MNRKQNIMLNCLELAALIIGTICLGICVKILPTIENKEIFEELILGTSLITNAIMISIEMILFLTYKLKYRIIYIMYLIFDLITLIYINTIVPFSGVIVILLLAITKATFRILSQEKIYVPNKLKKYMKLFKIKTKKKKKVTARKTRKQTKKVTVPKKQEQVNRKKAIA